MSAGELRLVIPGTPRGAERAGRNGRRSFTPPATAALRDELRVLWMAAGRPRLEGPLALHLRAYFPRPLAHYLSAGGLSAEGLRYDYPTGRGYPDGDNLAKAYTDPLQDHRGERYAFADDAQVIEWYIVRQWAARLERGRVEISLLPMAAPAGTLDPEPTTSEGRPASRPSGGAHL